jgi:polyhydroxybutyrate depolymerase
MTTACRLFAIAAAALLLWPQASSAQQREFMSWKVGGETRQAIAYAPLGEWAIGRAPLVLAFHGHGDTNQNFQHINLHIEFPEAIVVYFQGLTARDGLSGWQRTKGQDSDRDLAMVDAALTTLKKTFRVDETRIYAMGFSNGAAFTYLLWAERPGILAALAPVSGRLAASAKLQVPKPLFHIAGAKEASLAAQKESFDAATRVNGVEGQSASCGRGCTRYGARSATPATLFIHDGGHQYPLGTSERLARFFREHRLRPGR